MPGVLRACRRWATGQAISAPESDDVFTPCAHTPFGVHHIVFPLGMAGRPLKQRGVRELEGVEVFGLGAHLKMRLKTHDQAQT